jgi:hypothetical protein
MKIKKDIWNGGGYLYDDGDVPQCDYCGENAKEKAIYSTAHSGILICDSESCILDYAMNNIMTDELIHDVVECEVCDSCKEEEDVSYDGMCMLCWEDLNEHLEEE